MKTEIKKALQLEDLRYKRALYEAQLDIVASISAIVLFVLLDYLVLSAG